MRFILDENKARFILNERFILLEAEDNFADKQDILDKLSEYDDDLKAQLIKKLEKDFKVEGLGGTKEIKASEEAAKEAFKTDDANKIEAAVNDYVAKIKDFVNDTKGLGTGSPLKSVNGLDRSLSELTKVAATIKSNHKAIAGLQEDFTSLATNVNSALDTNAQGQSKENIDKLTEQSEKINAI